MDIALKPLYVGKIKTVYALEVDSQCPTDEYFKYAAKHDRAELDRLIARIQLVANQGEVRNETIFRHERDHIYEFKTKRGLRLYCFFDAGQIIVTVNGDDKGQKKEAESSHRQGCRVAETLFPAPKTRRYNSNFEIMKTKEKYTAADYFREADKSLDFEVESAKLGITEELLEIMEGQKISRSELARRMNVKPARITSLLRGSNNFTLETLIRAARSVNASLKLHLSPRQCETRWVDFEETIVHPAFSQNKIAAPSLPPFQLNETSSADETKAA